MDGIPRWFIGLVLIVMLALGIIMNAKYAAGQTLNGEIDICDLLNKEREQYDKLSSLMHDMYLLGEIKNKNGQMTDEMLHALDVTVKHYEGLRDETARHITQAECTVGEPG